MSSFTRIGDADNDQYVPNKRDSDAISTLRLSQLGEYRRQNGFTSDHVSLRERLSHFTWPWFECVMSTGALAALLGAQEGDHPFYDNDMRHTVLRRVGQAFFILELLLFNLFTFLICVRFWITPAALKASLHHPHESFFYGTYWVSIALILYGTQLYTVPVVSSIMGEESPLWLHITLEACFWIYAAGALQLVIFQYHVIFDEERLQIAKAAMPTWILPAYPFIIMGPLAAVILKDGGNPVARVDSAAPMLIGGIVFAGLGWSLAFIMYTVYFTRLISGALPRASKRPDMFVAVGPAGYTATTLASLGMQAPKVLPATYLGITSGVPTGDLWKAMSIPAAMFVWLVGFWFCAQAAVSCLRGARKMRFTLSWWAFIFPNAGLTMGMYQIGIAIDSTAIQDIVVPAVTAVLVGIWLLVAVMNVIAVWRGDVLWPGKDEDTEDILDMMDGRNEWEGEKKD
ncbi:voltage-dependent anion channel [Apiospora rasikravindrae]|uniref:Voltage-dependent anion channel n=1 Tax=Apiospora rasikravindrae TaxID=990691 RepID=A0ABR1S2A8_9PEZI